MFYDGGDATAHGDVTATRLKQSHLLKRIPVPTTMQTFLN